ncbi:hypothetical protein F1559_002175 [Cyanidiococcus yangmingshanensis]|uniref:Borealin N-terminal domain-containing protein n=1 Tax=Cyanidiococcus yangmingshanensis TaxID=2690220 RepID=A0A7J7IE15_9RHOD|nr:hypothetical protein F1559_002175 [Cyanidiococcus yangmingshanensis]
MDKENLELGLKDIEHQLETRCAEIRKAAEDAVLSLRNSYHSQLIRLPRKLRATPLSALFTAEELQAIGYSFKESTVGETVRTKRNRPNYAQPGSKDTDRARNRKSKNQRKGLVDKSDPVSSRNSPKSSQGDSRVEEAFQTEPGAREDVRKASGHSVEQTDFETALRTVLERLLPDQNVSVAEAAQSITPNLLKLFHERADLNKVEVKSSGPKQVSSPVRK